MSTFPLIVLSHVQVAPLLSAYPNPQSIPDETTAVVSLDLNRSDIEIQLSTNGLHLPDGQCLPWAQLAEISANENACFHIQDNTAVKINLFSEELQRAYSLLPTQSAPTMLVSGITMHRIINSDPHRDTLEKIRAAGKMTGDVLDTTMGLGYTAIQAAQTAAAVQTIELDPTVVEVCRLNPWSQDLFTNPKITRHVGHCWDVIEDEFADDQFSTIIHDPPMFNMAGELYSADFYRELYRILKPRGRLFHYIGNPDSKSGAKVTRGTIRRLKEVGFGRVSPQPRAFGVLAFK
jgi:predicted methyltransferase